MRAGRGKNLGNQCRGTSSQSKCMGSGVRTIKTGYSPVRFEPISWQDRQIGRLLPLLEARPDFSRAELVILERIRLTISLTSSTLQKRVLGGCLPSNMHHQDYGRRIGGRNTIWGGTLQGSRRHMTHPPLRRSTALIVLIIRPLDLDPGLVSSADCASRNSRSGRDPARTNCSVEQLYRGRGQHVERIGLAASLGLPRLQYSLAHAW